MDEQLKTNLTSKKHWMRFLYMLFFAALFYVGFLVSWLVIVIQFVFTLITGDDSDKLRQFGSSLSQFLSQTLNYLTYNSEQKPFPLDEWPEPIPLNTSSGNTETTSALNEDLVPSNVVAPVEKAFETAEDTKEPKEGEPVAVEEKLAAKIQSSASNTVSEKTTKETTKKAPKKTARKAGAKTSRKKTTETESAAKESAGETNVDEENILKDSGDKDSSDTKNTSEKPSQADGAADNVK